MCCNNQKIKKPKYNYGLLESPDTSYLSSSSNNETVTSYKYGRARNFEYENDRRHQQLLSSFRTEMSKSVNTTLPGTPTNKTRDVTISSKLTRFSTSDASLASVESIDVSTANENLTLSKLLEDRICNESSPVFQLPIGRAPRKTPKVPGKGNSVTPRSVDLSSVKSNNSRLHSETPTTPGNSRHTPHTSAPSESTETPGCPELSNIVSIVEGRGQAKGEIGMASISLRHPTLQLFQFADSQTYVKTITQLQILSPIEIIFPSTMCDSGNMAKVFRVVSDNFQNSNITTVQRHYFNEGKGLDYIKQLCIKEQNSVQMDVQAKYYCLAAAAALIKYVEFIQNTIFANNSLLISFKGSDQTTLIDASTASILELTINTKNPKSKHTLFGVLNHTRTPSGARLLRSNILQPPNDLETIVLRQNCVQELTDKKELFFGLKTALERLEIDLDSLLSSLVQIPKQETQKTAESKITTCILLKHILEHVPVMEEALSGTKSELFQAYLAAVKDTRFSLILNKTMGVIHEEAQYQKGHLNMKTQKCFAVKSGINGLLDAARRTYTELIEDINDLIEQLAEKHSLPLRCAHNASRGYFIQAPIHDQGKGELNLPAEFLKVSKSKKTLSCTTDDMICMNERVNQSVKNIYTMANGVVSELLKDIRDHVGCLYNLSETISTLDILLSFAHAVTTADYVRPEFTDTLAVKQGLHPVLDSIMGHNPPTPNSIYASGETNFNIITGPNMSGKSTYLKQVALLQIMAQIGSFVPAEYASFRLTDQIFSRVGSDDDIETNSSTFMLEMKEINYIIQNVTDNSLVIIDELGRGTSSEEGVGLCWSIAEFLLGQKAFTLFATHFLELCRLESVYPNVENYHFKIDHVTTTRGSLHKIVYTYVLTKGRTKEQHYGLQLAEIFHFPDTIIPRAHDIARHMQENNKQTDLSVAYQMRKEKATYRLANKLLQASRSSMLDDEALQQFLISLKTSYLGEITEDGDGAKNCDQEREPAPGFPSNQEDEDDTAPQVVSVLSQSNPNTDT